MPTTSTEPHTSEQLPSWSSDSVMEPRETKRRRSEKIAGETMQEDILQNLRCIDRINARIGSPERKRGLHYWLGFEYAVALTVLDLLPGQRVLDIGTGAYSTWPYILAHLFDIEIVVFDLASSLRRQQGIRNRAVESGICRTGQVHLVRADARQVPFADASFDAFSAMSSIEHVRSGAGDRKALREAARTLRASGQGIVSVPFRHAGSYTETDENFQLYQRHYSQETLTTSFLEPSGLTKTAQLYYGERWSAYQLMRRLPDFVQSAVRPWNAVVAAHAMQLLPGPQGADAVLTHLVKRAEAPNISVIPEEQGL